MLAVAALFCHQSGRGRYAGCVCRASSGRVFAPRRRQRAGLEARSAALPLGRALAGTIRRRQRGAFRRPGSVVADFSATKLFFLSTRVLVPRVHFTGGCVRKKRHRTAGRTALGWDNRPKGLPGFLTIYVSGRGRPARSPGSGCFAVPVITAAGSPDAFRVFVIRGEGRSAIS